MGLNSDLVMLQKRNLREVTLSPQPEFPWLWKGDKNPGSAHHMLWAEFVPCPPNSNVEILMFNIMVLGGGSFERWLGNEGRAFMGLVPHKRPHRTLAPSTVWGYNEKSADQKRTLLQLGCTLSQTSRPHSSGNKCLLSIACSLWCFVLAAPMNGDTA